MHQIYATIQKKLHSSHMVIATCLEGKHAGEKALYVEGSLCHVYGDESYWQIISKEKAHLTHTGIVQFGDQKIFYCSVKNRPRLILCGGGFVSMALCRMASMTDFEVWVLEDRPEFASLAEKNGAAKVICQPFDQGLAQIPQESDNYYVCLTRGHQYDMTCLRSILAGQYAYIGMMGSKKRSALMRENLSSEGFADQAVAAIHAPVGLEIHAQTPEEIAVAILAELIACRRGQGEEQIIDPAVLAYLADPTSETAVLCTIIEKNGSAPRSVGTHMLVTKSQGNLGTIGGGGGEAAIIRRSLAILQEAEQTTPYCEIQPMIMDTEEAAKAGMLCGGNLLVSLERMAGAVDA